ncbi:hypothetical protein [Nonomuraea sp. NPDC048916]|uniref:hypothetical protein n=1 Tax=Nonomuraea sp. NPDC048916 TaxID=3154232 RepID=UPI0033D0D2CA
MTRVIFSGGHVFDGTGAPPAPADVVIEGERILDVGPGLDGEEVVDCTGLTLLPGLFDAHVHLIVGPYDAVGQLYEPFSLVLPGRQEHAHHARRRHHHGPGRLRR